MFFELGKAGERPSETRRPPAVLFVLVFMMEESRKG